MTVQELSVLLAKARREGKGHWPVEIMIVEHGMTVSQSIVGGDIAQPYDGQRVWLYPEEGIINLPEWAAKFK